MTTFKRLVLSSGSLKGFLYVGVLRSLEEHNLVCHINEYVGVSIGSLFSLFMVLNYTSNEISDIILNLNLKTLMYPNILQLTEKYGMLDTTEIIKFIKEILIRKNVDGNTNLKSLYKRLGKKLSIYTTVLGDEHASIVLNHETYPDLEVYKAILMSISIPFVFPPVRHNDKMYIDGGIKNHFPIHLYNHQETLGCNLLEDIDDNDTFGNYFHMIYSAIYSTIPKDKEYNIMHLKVKLSTLDFFLDNKTKQFLFELGYKQATEWFKNKTLNINDGTSL